jgi:hypothetical protein
MASLVKYDYLQPFLKGMKNSFHTVDKKMAHLTRMQNRIIRLVTSPSAIVNTEMNVGCLHNTQVSGTDFLLGMEF